MKNSEKEKPTVFYLLRVARNKKVKDLAEELEVSPAYINAIESGQRYPSKRLLRDYAGALGVEVSTIEEFYQNRSGNQPFENLLLALLKMICPSDGEKDL